MASAYQTDAEVRGLVRKVMALSMVPQTEITPQFERLRRLAATPELTTLCDYFDRTWLQSTVWTVGSWCMYREAIRTNNDCEGTLAVGFNLYQGKFIVCTCIVRSPFTCKLNQSSLIDINKW